MKLTYRKAAPSDANQVLYIALVLLSPILLAHPSV